MQYFGPVLSVFLLMLVGYGAKRFRLLRVEEADTLNNVVVYLTLPAFIFTAIFNFKEPVTPSLIKIPFVGFAMIVVVVALAYAVGKLLKLDRRTLPGFILAAGFGNTGFLGYPLVSAVFSGAGALVGAAFYDEFAMALPLCILSSTLIPLFAGEKMNHAQIVRALKFPQLWTIPIALLLRPFPVPDSVVTAIRYLGEGTVPLVMISLGLSLSMKSLKGYVPAVVAVCALKLAILPFVTHFVANAYGITGVLNQVTTVEAGMPTALMVGVLVSKFGENGGFVAGVIFVSTLLSMATIPLTLFILGVGP